MIENENIASHHFERSINPNPGENICTCGGGKMGRFCRTHNRRIGVMANRYEKNGDITHIFITRKDSIQVSTMIDTGDLERIKPFTWCVFWNVTSRSWYVKAGKRLDGKHYGVQLHRFLCSASSGEEVDHINHDSLDNRRSVNLRVLNHSRNGFHRRGAAINNTSGFRGVTFHKVSGLWHAHAKYDKKLYSLGYFKEARIAGDKVQEFIEAVNKGDDLSIFLNTTKGRKASK